MNLPIPTRLPSFSAYSCSYDFFFLGPLSLSSVSGAPIRSMLKNYMFPGFVYFSILSFVSSTDQSSGCSPTLSSTISLFVSESGIQLEDLPTLTCWFPSVSNFYLLRHVHYSATSSHSFILQTWCLTVVWVYLS